MALRAFCLAAFLATAQSKQDSSCESSQDELNSLMQRPVMTANMLAHLLSSSHHHADWPDRFANALEGMRGNAQTLVEPPAPTTPAAPAAPAAVAAQVAPAAPATPAVPTAPAVQVAAPEETSASAAAQVAPEAPATPAEPLAPAVEDAAWDWEHFSFQDLVEQALSQEPQGTGAAVPVESAASGTAASETTASATAASGAAASSEEAGEAATPVPQVAQEAIVEAEKAVAEAQAALGVAQRAAQEAAVVSAASADARAEAAASEEASEAADMTTAAPLQSVAPAAPATPAAQAVQVAASEESPADGTRGTCPRPEGFCTHAGSRYINDQDCDGDCIPDPYCIDDTEQTGFYGSASSCAGNWPTGVCVPPDPAKCTEPTTAALAPSCPRPEGFCTHAGSRYANDQDCDGDCVPDPYCIDDTEQAGFYGSASSCAGNWPTGVCVPPDPAKCAAVTTAAPAPACPRPEGFCTHAGAVFDDRQDCDGDGVFDPYCIDDTEQSGFFGSARSCESTWPTGVCGEESEGDDELPESPFARFVRWLLR